jgi:hypothetical protein
VRRIRVAWFTPCHKAGRHFETHVEVGIFMNTLFLNIYNLCSSLKVRDRVSHPYKTAGKTNLVEV